MTSTCGTVSYLFCELSYLFCNCLKNKTLILILKPRVRQTSHLLFTCNTFFFCALLRHDICINIKDMPLLRIVKVCIHDPRSDYIHSFYRCTSCQNHRVSYSSECSFIFLLQLMNGYFPISQD